MDIYQTFLFWKEAVVKPIRYLLIYYSPANEVSKGYSKATVRPSFRNIIVNTLESTSFNGF